MKTSRADAVYDVSTPVLKNEALVYEVEGNAFLPHQVRRMVGALVDLGRERLKCY